MEPTDSNRNAGKAIGRKAKQPESGLLSAVEPEEPQWWGQQLDGDGMLPDPDPGLDPMAGMTPGVDSGLSM